MAKEIKNVLVNAIHDKHLRGYAKAYISGRLIDIGCGTKPYVDLFKPYVTEHIGVDREGTIHSKENIDLIGTAYEIPSSDEVFDSVWLCAELPSTLWARGRRT